MEKECRRYREFPFLLKNLDEALTNKAGMSTFVQIFAQHSQRIETKNWAGYFLNARIFIRSWSMQRIQTWQYKLERKKLYKSWCIYTQKLILFHLKNTSRNINWTEWQTWKPHLKPIFILSISIGLGDLWKVKLGILEVYRKCSSSVFSVGLRWIWIMFILIFLLSIIFVTLYDFRPVESKLPWGGHMVMFV